jgi:CHAD domain-containing protein
MPTSTPCYTLLKPRLARLSRALADLKQGDLDAVHPTRVATRRIRELLPILPLDADTSRKLNLRLRKLARRLGKLRDASVSLTLVERMLDVERPVRHALVKVREELRAHQKKSRVKDAGERVQADGRRLVKKLDRILIRLADEGPDAKKRSREVTWAVNARVVRRALVLRQAVEQAGSVYLPERLHKTRMATRRLRYAVELLADLSDTHRAAEFRVFERVQDELGKLHDAQTLLARARRMQGSLLPTELKTWQELDALNILLENRGRRLHAAYMQNRDALLHICERLAGRAAHGVAAKRKAS